MVWAGIAGGVKRVCGGGFLEEGRLGLCRIKPTNLLSAREILKMLGRWTRRI